MRSPRIHKLICAAIDNGLRLEGTQIISPYGNKLNPWKNPKSGYSFVNLTFQSESARVPYSRLICWLAYGSPPSDRHDADHRDRNRDNNHPSNLRWLEHRKNIHNSDRSGMIHRGEDNFSAKLNDDLVRHIRKLFDSGTRIRHISLALNIPNPTVHAVAHRQSWRHV